MSHSSALMISVSGIRGVIGHALSPGNALEFVQSYAAFLKKSSDKPLVLLARDTRPTGEMMRHAVLSGLIGAGCRVLDLGIVSTPTLQLSIPFHKADGAICITASHNPVEWNALKFFQPSGMYLDKAQGSEVIRIFNDKDFISGTWDQMGSVEMETESIGRHLEAILKLVDADAIRKRKFKVVLDGCCGAGNTISPLLIHELGCELVHINADLSGIFPHNPEPLPVNMVQLCDAVKVNGADIGFAHDADADRVAVVTNDGEFIGEDYSLVWAIAHYLKHRKRGPVVTNLSTSMAVETVARLYDCKAYRSAVGDANVSGMMHETGAVIGGEGNGGVIMPDIQYGRDGIAALAFTLDFLAAEGKTAGELHRELPHYFISKSTIDFPVQHMKPLLQWLKSREKSARTDERDGLRLDWPLNGDTTSWAHIRPSGTEPFVRVICEAATEAEAARMQKHLREEIESMAGAF